MVANDCSGEGDDSRDSSDVCPITWSLSVFNSPSHPEEGEHVATPSSQTDLEHPSLDPVEGGGSNSRKSSIRRKHSQKLFRKNSTKSKDGSEMVPSPAAEEDAVDKHISAELQNRLCMDSLSPCEEKEGKLTSMGDATGENGREEEEKIKEVESKKVGKDKDTGHMERIKDLTRKETKRHQGLMRKISGSIIHGLRRLQSNSEIVDPEAVNGTDQSQIHMHTTDGNEDGTHRDVDSALKRGSKPKFDMVDLTSDDVALKPMMRKLSYTDHIWLGMLQMWCRLTWACLTNCHSCFAGE